MTTKRKWVFITLICLVILLGIGIGIIKINQYRSNALLEYPAPGYPRVMITNPPGYSQFIQGTPILIETTAISAQKVLSIELFLDGVLIGEESAPPGGSDNFSPGFLWSPVSPGIYSLSARATSADQLTAISSPVMIEIAPGDSKPGAADSINALAPGPMDSSSGPKPPAPGSSTGPAKPWKGTPGNWFNNLTVKTAPNAPELVGLAEGCSAKLSIHDLSENEEGFEVWRLLPYSPTWSRIEVLASQSQADWIIYLDEDVLAGTTYYVSAFNNLGKQSSNLVYVNPDSADCNSADASRSFLTLSLNEIQPLIPVEKFYCYLSFDGSYWMRRPEVGFWPGGTGAKEGETYNIELISIDLQGDNSRVGDPESLSEYYLDCWGWSGATLKFLGAFSPSLDPNQEDDLAVASDNFNALVGLNKGLDGSPDFYPMGGYYGSQLGIYDPSMEELDKINLLLKTHTVDPGMPILSAFMTYSSESCKDHLPPSLQNFFGELMYCSPFTGFDLGDDGANPQPFFLWDPNGVPRCLSGQGPSCKSYYYWISLAADLGHEVGFNVYDHNDKGFYIQEVTAPEFFSYVIPPVPCSGTRQVWVQMWYYNGSSLLPTYGPPSNKVSLACPQALGPVMQFDIRFDEIILGNLNDGESEPQQIEAYGYMRASSESMSQYINLATWDGGVFAQALPDFEFPKSLSNGNHSLENLTLCRSDSYLKCSETGWNTTNNTIRLLIEEGDSLTINVNIVDQDSGFQDDVICQGAYQIASQSILDWHNVKNQAFEIGGQSSSGSCLIKGVLSAVNP